MKSPQTPLPEGEQHSVAAGSDTKASCAALTQTLEDTRIMWQHGEWAQLVELSEDTLERDRDRAKIAAILAAAHGQLGNRAKARKFAILALEWGCSRVFLARTLGSSVHNSLGRVACSLELESAGKVHFERAITLVEPRANVPLQAQTRRIRECLDLGFLSQVSALLKPDMQHVGLEPIDRLDALNETMKALRSEVGALQKCNVSTESAKPLANPMVRRQDVSSPFVVVIAGVPRSGSTWLFNAVKNICTAAELKVYAVWCEEYAPASQTDADVHIVKLHNPDHLVFPYHRVLTSKRNLVERLASIMRMGWLKGDAVSIQTAAKRHTDLAEYWHSETTYEIDFNHISAFSEETILNLAAAIDVTCPTEQAVRIVNDLDRLGEPEKLHEKYDHDEETLLHPNHRAEAEERNKFIKIVESALGIDSEMGL